ncbi:MAG TPA: thioesterase family protein [Vicinamibacterales bacterium]|nr:thioesterase family protein [Vicinamibacterales bacterium]
MFTHRLEVRFRDCDPMGHVNNAVYLTYLEQTRFSHWRSLWGFGTPQLPAGRPGVILARVECDYQRPAKYGDMLEIRMRVAALGRSSFRYEYEIVDEQGRTVLTAKTVQVMYDYTTEKPVAIPDEIRALLQTQGPGPGPA